MDRQTLYLNACHDTLSKLGALSYDFNPDQPRDDHGQWVAAGELESAKHDPAAAAALRSRVTRPKEKAKLEASLGAEAKPFTPRRIPQTSDLPPEPGAPGAGGAGGGAPGLQSHPDWDTILATLGGAGARQTPRRAMVESPDPGAGFQPPQVASGMQAANARRAATSAMDLPAPAWASVNDARTVGRLASEAMKATRAGNVDRAAALHEQVADALARSARGPQARVAEQANRDAADYLVDAYGGDTSTAPRTTSRRAMVDTSGGGELGHIPLDLRDEFNGPARNARYAEPSASISPEKARQILHDGTVHGHPLTDAQRGMFGAAAGRTDNDARFRYAADPAPNQYNCPGFPHDSFGRPRGVMQTIGHGAFRGGRFGADSGDTPYDGDVRRGPAAPDPSDLFLALSLLGHQARDLRRRD